MYLDDNQFIDLPGLGTKCVNTQLEAGKHKIKVQWFQAWGGAILRLTYRFHICKMLLP